MLSDFTGADKVYIACGYTDLRRGIDGLAAMVQQQFDLNPFTNTLFLFCGRRRIGSRHFIGKAMDLCCFTSGWNPAASNGPGRKARPERSLPNSTAGSWKG